MLVKNVTWTTLSPGTSSGTVSAGATSNVKLATDTVAGTAWKLFLGHGIGLLVSHPPRGRSGHEDGDSCCLAGQVCYVVCLFG